MSVWLLLITACLYFWSGVGFAFDGKIAWAVVMFSFFLSNLALAYASQQ